MQPIVSVKIKKIADLENVFGVKLARQILTLSDRSSMMRAKPSYVSIYEEKPAFYLNDGDTLTVYGLDLVNEKITGKAYCGSSDTVINHMVEQLSEGISAPENFALMFLTTYWNGSDFSWSLTVVTKNVQRFLKS